MQFDEVRRLIRLVEESDVDELDIWKWWGRIRIRKNVGPSGAVMPYLAAGAHPAPTPAPASQEVRPASEAPAPAAVDDDAGLVPVKSPMVGTAYRAPAPDADPYVQSGDMIEVGQTVCIVEAMKLMNEIQSEVRGKVVRILVDNAQPVEFGQTLFLVQEM